MINCLLFYTYIFNREMSDVISAALRQFVYTEAERRPQMMSDANALGPIQWST